MKRKVNERLKRQDKKRRKLRIKRMEAKATKQRITTHLLQY